MQFYHDEPVFDINIFYSNYKNRCDENHPIINTFLDDFFFLYDSFREKLELPDYTGQSASARDLRIFLEKTGGTRAARILAGYEASASIGDRVNCGRLRRIMLDEIALFQEAVLSTLG